MRWRLTPAHRRHSFTYANGKWETLVFVYCITEKRFLLHWYAPVLFQIAAPFQLCQQPVQQCLPLHWHLNWGLTPLSAITRWLSRSVFEPLRTDQMRATLRQSLRRGTSRIYQFPPPPFPCHPSALGRILLRQAESLSLSLTLSYPVSWNLGAFRKIA